MTNPTSELTLRVSSTENKTVRALSGEKIGTIMDIVMDALRGEIAYVVLAADTGFLNMGSKYYAVPWGAFSFKNGLDDAFVLDISKEKLENSPGFDKDDWPSGSQAKFIAEVYNYYDLKRPDRFPSYEEDINQNWPVFDRPKKPMDNSSFRNSMNFLL